MSKAIDERVVSMKFDNSQFENNVQTSMSTLDKLKKALNLDGASKGLAKLSASSKNFSMNPVGNAVETVKTKFSALQVVGITALANITNSAVESGKRIVSALTIDPIKTGFNEYELKMGSIQTIMASTGESLQTVNRYLNELNTYSDKTIYSFSDMTTNIGKFTNAGVKLEDAVMAIKGVSNEAAVSGANANEASRAMYNFAQALSAGYVKLIDWKSIELANMATVEFKNQLIETATSVGTLTKETDGYRTSQGTLITATSNFNESLQDQWMTTDVLIGTLSKYSDETTDIGKKAYAAAQDVKTFSMMMDTLKETAQSGWAATWEIVVGDYEQAKGLFTSLTTVIGGLIDKMSDSRNAFLTGALVDTPWTKLSTQIEDAGISLNDFQNGLIKTAKTHGIEIDKMIQDTGSFTKSLEKGWLTSDIITETLNGMVDASGEVSSATSDMTARFEELNNVVKKVMNGDFGNSDARMKALADAGYDYAEVQGLVNKFVEEGSISVNDLSDAQLTNMGYTKEQVSALRELATQAEQTGTPLNKLMEDMAKPSGRSLLIDSFKNIQDYLTKIKDKVTEVWKAAFPESLRDKGADFLYNLIDKFHSFTEKLEVTDKGLNNITDTVTGFVNALKLVAMFSSPVFATMNLMWKYIKNILGIDMLGLTAKLGNLITSFYNWLRSGNPLVEAAVRWGKSLLDSIDKTIGKIKDFVKAIAAFAKANGYIEAFSTAFSTTVQNVSDFLYGFIKIFGKFINKLKSLDDITFDDIVSAVKDMFVDIWNHLKSIGSIFTGLGNLIGKFYNSVSGNLSKTGSSFGKFFAKVSGFVKGIRNALSEFVDGIGFAEVATAAIGGLLILTIVGIGKIFSKWFPTILGFAQGWEKIANSMSSMFRSFGKAKVMEARSVAIRNIAISIGILAASLWLLAKLDWGQIGKGLTAIAGLAIILGVLSFALSKFGSISASISVGGFGFMLLAFAGSIYILVDALKQIETLDKNQMGQTLTYLAGIMLALVLAVGIFGKMGVTSSKGALVLIALAISLKILVSAIQDIANLKIDNMIRTIGLLFTLLLSMSLLMKSAGKLGGVGSALTLLATVVALKMFIGAFKDLAELDANTIVRGIISFIIVFGLYKLLLNSTISAGKNSARAGFAILSMAASLLLIAVAIRMIAGMETGDIIKGLAVVAACMLLFQGIVQVSLYAGKNAARAGVMILAMGVSMLLLAGAITILSHIELGGLAKAMGAVMALGFMFAVLIKATEKAKAVDKTIMMMAITIGILAIALATLAAIKPSRLASATASLVGVMAVMALMIKCTSYIQAGKSATISSVATLAMLTLVVAALAFIISRLAGVDPITAISSAAAIAILLMAMARSLKILDQVSDLKPLKILATMGSLTAIVAALAIIIGLLSFANPVGVLASAASLSVLLLALSVCCVILDGVGPTAMNGVPVVYAMLGVVVGLAIILGVLSNFGDAGSYLEIAKSLSILLLSLSVVCVILGAVGLLGPASFIGIGALVTLIASLTIVMGGLGALAYYFPQLKQFVNEGIPLLQALGTGLGSFFGGIVGGFTSAATSGLDETADNLSSFIEKLQPFITGVSNITPEALTGIESLSKAMLMLTGANFIDSMIKTLSFGASGESSFATFAEGLAPLGKALAKISTYTIAPEKISTIGAATEKLVEIQNDMENQGGFSAKVFGDNTFARLANGLVPMAKALVKISACEISSEKIETIATASKSLIEVQNTMQNQGGLLSGIMGDNTLAKLATGLVPMAKALAKLSDYEIDISKVTQVATASKSLIEVQNTMQNQGGVLSGIMGDNTLAKLAKDLVPMAKALAKISAYEIDTSKVTQVAIASKQLASASKICVDIDTSGLEDLGDAAKDLSKGLSAACSNLEGDDPSSVASSIKQIASALKTANNTNVDKIDAFVKAVKKIGNLEVDTGSLQASSGKIKSSVSSMMSTIKSTVANSKSGVSSALKGAFGGMSSAINSVKGSGVAAATALVKGLIDPIKKAGATAKNYARSMANGAVSGFRSAVGGARSAGSAVGQGFVNGVVSKRGAARSAGYGNGAAATAGFRAAAKVASPSKVTRKIGEYVGLGFILGLKSMTSDIRDTGYGLGETAVTAIGKTVSKISEAIDSDMDTQPTIRPVLDLSNISNGASAIGGMLGSGSSVGVMANLGAINGMMSNRQNGANNDVISAIKDLGKTIGNSSGDTYRIDGITYDDGTGVSDAIKTLVRAAKVERRR